MLDYIEKNRNRLLKRMVQSKKKQSKCKKPKSGSNKPKQSGRKNSKQSNSIIGSCQYLTTCKNCKWSNKTNKQSPYCLKSKKNQCKLNDQIIHKYGLNAVSKKVTLQRKKNQLQKNKPSTSKYVPMVEADPIEADPFRDIDNDDNSPKPSSVLNVEADPVGDGPLRDNNSTKPSSVLNVEDNPVKNDRVKDGDNDDGSPFALKKKPPKKGEVVENTNDEDTELDPGATKLEFGNMEDTELDPDMELDPDEDEDETKKN